MAFSYFFAATKTTTVFIGLYDADDDHHHKKFNLLVIHDNRKGKTRK